MKVVSIVLGGLAAACGPGPSALDEPPELAWELAFDSGANIRNEFAVHGLSAANQHIVVVGQVFERDGTWTPWAVLVRDDGEVVWERTYDSFGTGAAFAGVRVLDDRIVAAVQFTAGITDLLLV